MVIQKYRKIAVASNWFEQDRELPADDYGCVKRDEVMMLRRFSHDVHFILQYFLCLILVEGLDDFASISLTSDNILNLIDGRTSTVAKYLNVSVRNQRLWNSANRRALDSLQVGQGWVRGQ